MTTVSVRYVPDEQGMHQTFRSWDGPVGKDLTRRGRTLQFRARKSVGVRTGDLRADLKTTRKQVRNGLELEIGSDRVKYALLHHMGTRPHPIYPRKPGGRLRFVVAGKVVFARKVNHPGTRPNPYLTRHLAEAVR